MKELSIEEKARRYDGAIKRLEDIETGKCQKTFMFTEGLFDYIFPELKESEDERIRKSLSVYFAKFKPNDMWDADFSFGDIVTWLEKQAQKPVAWSEEDKRKIDRIYSMLRQASDTHSFSTSCRLIGDKECIELQDFLKSIIHQSQWKPSEREKEALLWCVVHLGGADKQTLGELLEELNKL